ncbi:MAG: serine/threonine-protein kinase, partial [Fimbriiglobus sp.]
MAQQWFIDYGTWVDGPLTSRELQDRAAVGRLRPTDKVSPDRQRWRDAGNIKGLTFPAPTVAAASTSNIPTALMPPSAFAADGTPDLPPTTPSMPLDAPNLPGYEMLGALGFGGCGIVYKARQTKLDRVVAIKTVQLTGRPDPKATARFEKEAMSLARLQHPNIVNVFDSGRHDGLVYFAMELLKGEDLGLRIGRVGRLDERTTWAVARQTAAALAHAAAEGMYHRDVKPANLFLVPMPTGFGLPADLPMVKVTDFGLAITRQDQDAAGGERLTA